MTIWIPNLGKRGGPRYLAIAEALSDDIARGTLAAETRLPTHRDLAYRLGVTVGTVSRAYAEAERRGLVRGEVGRGTFVRVDPEPAAPIRFGAQAEESGATVDLSLNCPHEADDSAFRATLADLTAEPDIRALLAFRPGAGAPAHREAASRLVARLGWAPDPARMAVTNGAQHALSAVLAAICRPGDTVVCETLTYPGIRAAAELIGLRVKPIDMDEEGMIPSALEEALAAVPAKAICAQPTLHNPTTATMSPARRDGISEIVARHGGVTLIEDDVYGHHLDRPQLPIAARVPERTVFITSASKCLMPGLRTGYLAAPEALHGRIVDAIRTTSWMASPLEAEIAARWIDDGRLDQMVAARRRELARRAALLRNALAGASLRLPQGSFHAWVDLPEGWTVDSARGAARDINILLPPTEAFVIGRAVPPRSVRLSISHSDAAQFDEAVPRLAALFGRPRPASLAVI